MNLPQKPRKLKAVKSGKTKKNANLINLDGHVINNPVFSQGLKKLYHSTQMEPKVARKISRVAHQVDLQLNLLKEKAIEVHKKYGVWDEEKSTVKIVVPEEGGMPNPPFKTTEDEKKHDEDFNKMLDDFQFTIDLQRFPLPCLRGANLSPAEWDALEPIFVDVD